MLDIISKVLQKFLPELVYKEPPFVPPASPPDSPPPATLFSLFSHYTPAPITDKQLALMHGDSFIFNSGLEGGNPEQQLKYYLDALQKQEGPLDPALLDAGVSPQVKSSLLLDLKDALKATQLLSAKQFQQLQQEIYEGLNKRGRFAMPLMYAGKNGDPGHVFGGVFERDAKGNITCRLLNKGEGASEHLPVKITDDGIYFSCQFPPIELHDKQSFHPGNAAGLRFLELLGRYQNEVCPNNVQEYSSNELYNVFLTIGTIKQKLTAEQLAAYAAHGQLAGTCSDQFIDLLSRDAMVWGSAKDKRAVTRELKHFKRFMLFKKFQTLLDAARVYQNQGTISPALILQSAKNFAESVDKKMEQGLIDRVEFEKCLTLVDWIKRTIPDPQQQGRVEQALPPLNEVFTSILHPKCSMWRTDRNSQDPLMDPRNYIDIVTPPKPSEVRDFLANIKLSSMAPQEKIFAIHRAFKTLPIPQVGQDVYWDSVPKEHIEDVLTFLDICHKDIRLCLERHSRKRNEYGRHLVLFESTALAITDKLCRRLPEMRLEGYHAPIHLNALEPRIFFHRGDEALRFETIKRYFAQIRQQNPKELFAYGEISNKEIKKHVRAYSRGDRSTPSSQHFAYLDQFTDKLNKNDYFNETEKFMILASTSFRYEYYKKRYSGNFPNRKLEIIGTNQGRTIRSVLPTPYHIMERFYYHTNNLVMCQKDNPGNYPRQCWEHSALEFENINSTCKKLLEDDGTIQPWDQDPDQEFDILKVQSGRTFDPPINDKKLANHNAQPIDDKVLQNLLFSKASFPNENALVTQDAGKGDPDRKYEPSTYNDVKKIVYKHDLKIASLAKFCDDNFHLVEDSDMKAVVEFCALNGSYLIEKVNNEPLMIQGLRTIVDKHITYNHNSVRYKDALYWIRLAIHLESHFAQAKGRALDTERLSKLQHHLSTLQTLLDQAHAQAKDKSEFVAYEYNVLLHQLYLQTIRTSYTPQQMQEIVNKWLVLNYLDSQDSNMPFWMYQEIQSIMISLAIPLQEQMNADPQFALQCASDLIRRLDLTLKSTKVARACYCGFHILKNENDPEHPELEVDFVQGILRFHRSRVQVSAVPDQLKDLSPYKHLIGASPGKLVRFSRCEWVNEQGSLKIIADTSYRGDPNDVRDLKIAFQKKLRFAPNPDQFYEYKSDADLPFGLSKDKQCWKAVGDSHYYLLEQDGITPYARGEWLWDQKGECTGIEIYRLDEQGRPTHDREILLKRPQQSPFHDFLAQASDPKTLRLWGRKIGESATYALSSFELTDLNHLTFTVTHGQAHCQQFPEYILAERQQYGSAGRIKGCVTLQKIGADPKKIVVLPVNEINGYLPYRSSNIEISSGKPLQKDDKADRFFSYEVDEKTNKLYSSSVAGMLYLAYSMLYQGLHEEAADALARMNVTRPYSAEEWLLIEAIMKHQDESLAANAVKMRLGLEIVDNHHLVQLNSKTPSALTSFLKPDDTNKNPKTPKKSNSYFDPDSVKDSEPLKNLNKTIKTALARIVFSYERYLNQKGTQEHSGLPKTLRVDAKQEKQLLWLIHLAAKQIPEIVIDQRLTPHLHLAHRKKALEFAKKNKVSSHPVQKTSHIKNNVTVGTDYYREIDAYIKKYQKQSPVESRRDPSYANVFNQLRRTLSRNEINDLVNRADFSDKISPRVDEHEIFNRTWPLLKKAVNAKEGEFDAIDLDIYALYNGYTKSKNDAWKSNYNQGCTLISLISLARRYPNKFREAVLAGNMQQVMQIADSMAPWPTIAQIVNPVLRFYDPKDQHFGRLFGFKRPSYCKEVKLTQDFKDTCVYQPAVASVDKQAVDLNAFAQGCDSRAWTHPMGMLFEKFFTRTPKDVLSADHKTFALENASFDVVKQPLAARILSNLKEAFYKIVSKKTYFEYVPKPEAQALLKTDLEQSIATATNEMNALKNEIEKLANAPSDAEMAGMPPEKRLAALHHRNQIHSGRATRLTLDNCILLSTITQEAQTLKKQNPWLNDDHIKRLHTMTILYMLCGSAVKQAQEALQSVENGKLIDAAKVIDKNRNFDPFKHPALLYYEYQSGNMLRTEPDQAQLLQRIIQLVFYTPRTPETIAQVKKLFFEFQAGGGKTKVLSTVLAAIAIMQGKQPVFFSLPEIYDITKEDLSQSLRQTFGIKAEELDVRLDSQPNEQQLENIYWRLKNAWKKGRCIITNPESFHALHIDLQNAREEGADKRVKWLSLIMDHFEEHSIFLVDEGHRNADSLLMTNYATGTPTKLPNEQREFLLKVYKLLTGSVSQKKRLKLDDGTDVAELLELRQNKQALKSEKEVQAILNALGKRFLDLLNIPTPARQEMLRYLLNKDVNPPSWFEEWNQEKKNSALYQQAQLINLARGLLTSNLKHAFGLVETLDYGPSVIPGRKVETPRYQKTATTSEFESPDISAILSNQGLYQRGLTTAEEMRTIIASLQVDIGKERGETPPGLLTKTEELFKEWQRGEVAPIMLSDISNQMLNEDELMIKLVHRVGKQPKLIDRYLQDVVLPQVMVYPNKFTSTAADLSNGSLFTIHFSATLGAAEQYPHFTFDQSQDEVYWQDIAFLAEVTHRACLPHNSQMLWLDPNGPKKLFEDCFTKDRTMFERLDGVINLGGWSKEYTNLEWAQQFLEFSHAKQLGYDGVVITREEMNVTTGNIEKTLYLQLYKVDGEHNCGKLIKLRGSNLLSELERLNLKGKRFFKIFGANDTTGTDLALMWNAKMLLCLGEKVDLSALAQAILRMRAFLWAIINGDSQTIIWIGSHKLREKIAALVGGDSPAHIFIWAILQEAERQGKSILLRAYQEIDHVIRRIVKDKMKANLKNPFAQIKLQRYHKLAFWYQLGRDLFMLYGQGSSMFDTTDVLSRYAKSFAQAAKIDLDAYPEAKQSISDIIAQTAKILPLIPHPKGPDSSARMKQNAKQEQRQQVKQQQRSMMTSGLQPAPITPYAAGELKLGSEALRAAKSPHIHSARKLYANDLLSSDLYIMNNAIKTLRGEEDGLPQTKPFERILVLREKQGANTVHKAFVVSLDDASSYEQQLIDGVSSNHGIQAALFTANGMIDQNGHGALAISDVEVMMQGEWFRKIVTDAGLLSLKVRNDEMVGQMGQQHPDQLAKLWDTAANSRSMIDAEAVEHHRIKFALPKSEVVDVKKNERQKEFDAAYHETLRPTVSKFFTQHIWAWPLALVTLGLFPLALKLYYIFKK